MEKTLVLTEEQKLLVEEHHNLIYSFLRTKGLSVDENYGVAAIGLCKAAAVWDSSKGAFSTIAYTMMNHEIIRESVYLERHNARTSVSLDSKAYKNATADDRDWYDFLLDDSDCFSACALATQLKRTLHYCSDRELIILRGLILEHRAIDIAKSMSIGKKNAHTSIDRLRVKLKKQKGPRQYKMTIKREELLNEINGALLLYSA